MPARLFLSSGDLTADRRFEFARDLQLKGDLAAAADLLLQAIELAPNFASAWSTLGEIRVELGQADAAIAAFRKVGAADSDDRHGASLHLMRLGAQEIAAMPQAYVQVLFDQYAPRFEAALVGDLATDRDAQRLAQTGVPVRQITTGTVCSTASAASNPVDCTSRPSPHSAFSLKSGVGLRVSPS